jgi:hypothetical protein
MAEQYKFPDELEDNKTQKVEIIQPEDDVEIEIVDDTPIQDRGRRPLDREVEDPTDEEIESYTRGAQDRIKELTHARHDERRAKEALLREKQELERLAQHYVDENNKLKQYVNNGTQQYGAMAQTAAGAELDKARREYKAAQESFDTDAILAAQEALFEAKTKLQQAQNFRPPPLQVEESAVQPRQQQTQSVQPDEKTLRWQAKNQWFGADGFEEVTSFALGLHQKLVNSGVDPRENEYFEQIDARVKSKFPEVFGGNDERPKSSETPRRPSSVVAPASRSTGTRKVQLTPSQAALIKKYNLDPKKYVAEVLKLENQNG